MSVEAEKNHVTIEVFEQCYRDGLSPPMTSPSLGSPVVVGLILVGAELGIELHSGTDRD